MSQVTAHQWYYCTFFTTIIFLNNIIINALNTIYNNIMEKGRYKQHVTDGTEHIYKSSTLLIL